MIEASETGPNRSVTRYSVTDKLKAVKLYTKVLVAGSKCCKMHARMVWAARRRWSW